MRAASLTLISSSLKALGEGASLCDIYIESLRALKTIKLAKNSINVKSHSVYNKLYYIVRCTAFCTTISKRDNIMNTITYTDFRSNLKDTMDEVIDNHSHVIVTRGKTKRIVIMSLEDFSSYEETSYLMRSPANAKNLAESVQELKEGKGIKMTIKEWKEKYNNVKNK